MDGRGGCCIARYAGGAYNMSKVHRIMLRFRPIAPKPATGGSSSGGSSPDMSDVSSKPARGKRRNSSSNGNRKSGKRCNGGNNGRKRKALSEEKVDAVVVTLPLLPEAPDRKVSPSRESPVAVVSQKQAKNNEPTSWLSLGSSSIDASDHHHNNQREIFGNNFADRSTAAVMSQATRVVWSCVTVECVTDAWVNVNGLGRTDEERMAKLGMDACPGFISDGFGRVTWTNDAYRKLVDEEGGSGGEMVVWLMMKGKAPVTVGSQRAFSCRLRVQYVNRKGGYNGKEKSSITVPCDVWRMEGGGFAWRLDVKAALCLGR